MELERAGNVFLFIFQVRLHRNCKHFLSCSTTTHNRTINYNFQLLHSFGTCWIVGALASTQYSKTCEIKQNKVLSQVILHYRNAIGARKWKMFSISTTNSIWSIAYSWKIIRVEFASCSFCFCEGWMKRKQNGVNNGLQSTIHLNSSVYPPLLI